MLEELRIGGLGVIDEAVLPLGPGLTVLTGETGVGKTMLVTALLLLFGGRADAARIRTGAPQATVDGLIRLPADRLAEQRVRDAGGEVDDGLLTLRRQVSAAGRSRAFVGGAPAPVGVLAELAQRLVVVHGQADQQRLARPAQQRAALDRYAGLAAADYAAAFQRWRTAEERFAQRTAQARELRREADVLSRGIAEIRAAAPQPDEDRELARVARRLADVDSLRTAVRAAHDALLGDPDDPAGDTPDVGRLVGTARRALGQVQDADLDALTARLDELARLVADIGADLADYRDALDADPERLAQIEQRRSVLGALTRRYGDDIAAVLAWADESEQRLLDLDVSDEALAALAADRDRTRRDAASAAAQLTTGRREGAVRLSDAITAELSGLAMGSARLEIAVRPRPVVTGQPVLDVDGIACGAGPDGVDEIEFLLRAHSDAPPVALGRGASGGELSRVMLAVEVCLAGTDPVPTMVFDEVDAGVGGRAAVEVGRRLARLAEDHQVIVVTHLAQVAAFAAHHLVVDRATETATATEVREVSGSDRERELARMLAGSDSETARQHAAELIASTEAERDGAQSRRTGAVGTRRSGPRSQATQRSKTAR